MRLQAAGNLGKRGGVRRLAIEQLEARCVCVAGLLAGGVPPTLDYSGVGKVTNDVTFPNVNNGAECSGTLLPSGRHILTAAHCFEHLMDEDGNFISFSPFYRFYFEFFDYCEENDDHCKENHLEHIWLPFDVSTNSSVNDVFVHPNFRPFRYREGYDIAIIDLDEEIDRPTFDIFRGDNEFTPGDPTTGILEFVGYGLTGDGGLISPGCNEPWGNGIRRQGTNRIETFADSFNGVLGFPANHFQPPFTQLAFDFDSGSSAHDAFGAFLTDLDDPVGTTDEAGYGVHDSGGPNFIDGKIAGVTSWGLNKAIVPALTTDPCLFDQSTVGEVMFATRVSSFAKWIDSYFPPKVAGVSVGAASPGSQSLHADYLVPSGFSDNVAQQLRNVPIARANQIGFRFSKPISDTQGTLSVYGINGINYVASDRTYDSDTWTMTWTISPPLADNGAPDQIEFVLSDIVDTTSPAMGLDGNWVQLDSLSDPDASSFPSGDWRVDASSPETFSLQLSFIPADFTLDNVVDGSDFGAWNANKFTFTGADGFTRGDANGDNAVDGSDFGTWNAWEFTNWETWHSSLRGSHSQLVEVDGVNAERRRSDIAWRPTALIAILDEIIARHCIYVNGVINTDLSQGAWLRFADEFMEALNNH